jgi:hypothetical protein
MPHRPRVNRGLTRTRLSWVLALVVGLHLWVTGSMLDEMAGLQPDAPRIERMQAQYVAEVRLTTPPAAPAMAPAMAAPQQAALKPVRRKKPAPPPEAASAASEAEKAEAEPIEAPHSDEAGSNGLASARPDARESQSSTANESVTGAEGQDRFVWPIATRLSYVLEGFYRGPVHGQSTVEWIRQDQRYQVHIDVSLGPRFAPLGSWRLSSEGEIRPEGLHPRRYENVNRLMIRGARSRVIDLGDEEILLADGKKHNRAPGLQDPASFMIQVAYQFILDPSKAKPGSSFEMTMLTLRKPERLVFDVVDEVVIETPMGKILTLHVKPRKAVQDDGALPADVWFAPGLQYLPVRMRMKMKDETWMEMNISRAPQQTPGQAAAASSAASSP